MYYTKGLYQKRAIFNNEDAMHFFIKAVALANKQYQEGVRLNKDQQIVVYGSTINDFNPELDGNIARVEMNERGVLRSFIGVDWDLKETETYQQLKKALRQFSKDYHTPVLFYPTSSYPKKPHCRSVCFVSKQMDATDYARAVTWLEKTLEVSGDDQGNYSIKHNFNAPAFLSEEAYEETTWFLDGEMLDPRQLTLEELSDQLAVKEHFLNPSLWKNVKPIVKPRKSSRFAQEFEIERTERMSLEREEIKKGQEHLMNMIKNEENFVDFSKYNNFFQFLHALARAQVLGSMTFDEVKDTLVLIAQGNREYEQRNIKDYQIELKRVMGDETKLKRARPISCYFGTMM